jgi:hypothetical protein
MESHARNEYADQAGIWQNQRSPREWIDRVAERATWIAQASVLFGVGGYHVAAALIG